MILRRTLSANNDGIVSKIEIVGMLGLNWDSNKDVLHSKYSVKSDVNTKRGIVSEFSKIYDPTSYHQRWDFDTKDLTV